MAKDANKTKKEKKVKDKSFFKDLKSELKKVVWPTPKRLANHTAIVVGMILITAAIVFCLDVAFDNGYQFFVDKSQAVVQKIEGKDAKDTASENATNESTDVEVEDATNTEGTDE